MFGIDVVISLIKGVLAWVEANKKVQEKVQGLITYLKAINTALTSFKPKGPPSSALTEILTVTYQCVRDIQDLLDQVKQGQKKWLFSPDSYYSKLNKKEHELSTIIPVLSLSFNMELYHKSEDIQAALSPSAQGQVQVQPSYQLFTQPQQVIYVQQPLTYVPYAQPLSPLTPLSPHTPLNMTPTAGSPAPAPGAAAASAKLAQSYSQGMSAAGAGAGAAAASGVGGAKAAAGAGAGAGGDAKGSPAPAPPPISVQTKPLADALLTGDARDFWKSNFKHALTVGTGTLVDRLEAKHALACGFKSGKFDSKTRDALVMAVDHNKDEVITIYEFAKFATPTLEKAVAAVAIIPPTHKQDAESPCHVLWCDANMETAENKKVVEDAKKAGAVVVQVPSAKDGIEFLKVRSDLLAAENFRIISSNAIYVADPADANKRLTTQEVLDAKMSAAEDIIRYVRRKRSFAPILIYCNFTFPQAEKIAKLYTVVNATKSQADATAFAKLEAVPWIQEKMKLAMA